MLTSGLTRGSILDPDAILWPEETRQLGIDFPERLVSGAYRLIATVQFDPRQEPTVIETPFQIGGLTGDPIPLCSAA